MKYMILGMVMSVNCLAVDEVKLQIPNMVRAAEIKYELPEGILAAVTHVESSGNHKAIVHNDGKSGKTSYGLLQIQLASARTVGFKGRAGELMRPETNIEYGAKYLRWLLDTHNDNTAWALSCFNAGPNSFICKNKKYSPYVGLVLNAMIASSR